MSVSLPSACFAGVPFQRLPVTPDLNSEWAVCVGDHPTLSDGYPRLNASPQLTLSNVESVDRQPH